MHVETCHAGVERTRGEVEKGVKCAIGRAANPIARIHRPHPGIRGGEAFDCGYDNPG